MKAFIFLYLFLFPVLIGCDKTSSVPLDQEEETNVDPIPDPGIEEAGDVYLSFSTRVLNTYELPRELNLFISTDFDGIYSYDKVNSATWKNISDKFSFPLTDTGLTPGGETDISEYLTAGSPFFIAFRYKTTEMPPAARIGRNWRVEEFSLSYHLKEESKILIQQESADWTLVEHGEVDPGRGGTIQQNRLNFYSNNINRDISLDIWAITKPIILDPEIYTANCYDFGTCYDYDLPKSPGKTAEEVYIPNGFVETSDIIYFKVDEQGSAGVIEKVISDYNKHIVGKVDGYTQEVTSKEELSDKDGKPLDWNYRMDIIHPVTPSKPRPVFLVVGTQIKRNMPRHTPFQQVFAKRGYVTVIIDHAWSPIDRLLEDNAANYSLESLTGVKAYTAAIRYLRANAEKYSIDPERIGGLGHSKGSYAIARLSDPTINHASSERFQYIEPMSPQPNTGYPSHIQVGYQSMGNGTRGSRSYVKDNYPPTITAVGKYDTYNQWAVWPDVVAAYAEDRSANWLGIPMLDRGHEMATGVQHDLGYVREEAVEKFFSNYLEPDLPPNVLYVAPFNGYNNENIIKANQPVIVHFSPRMDVASVKDMVKVLDMDSGQEVKGEWKVLRKDTYFIFTPGIGSFQSKHYKVTISSSTKSIHGVSLGKPIEHVFSIN
ncbi:DUF5017 domain-containing protein [Proteiniphilum sp. UBA5384]|uniref:DUF5017 domain-containing protein n=1 Tax=Proteiniphilum sp. UBA5384 TaxID=1947279 RepID=UPI0025D7814A|nr:DUF5017 domain-containing protein [Proteiniphilum sp. UBA5384]